MPAAPRPPTSSPPLRPQTPPQDIIRQHGRTALLLLLAVLAPLLLFADLAEDVLKHGGFVWDRTILDWYAARRTPGLTQAAQGLALVAGVGGLPIITLLVAWGLHRGARANVHAAFLVLAVAGATLLNVLAKVVFHRPRPDELIAVLREPGFSFPSGHAMANAAFGIALALVFWRSKAGWPLAVFGVVWALLVGASRNYLGVHYPSDVLAGFLASTAWVFGLYLTIGQRWPALRRAPAGKHDTRPALKR